MKVLRTPEERFADLPRLRLPAAVRAMPELVPTTPDDPAAEANRAAWRRLAAWDNLA